MSKKINNETFNSMFDRIADLISRTPDQVLVSQDKFAQFYDQDTVAYMQRKGIQSVRRNDSSIEIKLDGEKHKRVQAQGRDLDIVVAQVLNCVTTVRQGQVTLAEIYGITIVLDQNDPDGSRAVLKRALLEPAEKGLTKVTVWVIEPYFGSTQKQAFKVDADGTYVPNSFTPES